VTGDRTHTYEADAYHNGLLWPADRHDGNPPSRSWACGGGRTADGSTIYLPPGPAWFVTPHPTGRYSHSRSPVAPPAVKPFLVTRRVPTTGHQHRQGSGIHRRSNWRSGSGGRQLPATWKRRSGRTRTATYRTGRVWRSTRLNSCDDFHRTPFHLSPDRHFGFGGLSNAHWWWRTTFPTVQAMD